MQDQSDSTFLDGSSPNVWIYFQFGQKQCTDLPFFRLRLGYDSTITSASSCCRTTFANVQLSKGVLWQHLFMIPFLRPDLVVGQHLLAHHNSHPSCRL